MHVFDPAFPYAPNRSYTPGNAEFAQYSADSQAWNVGRTVLVQPSPYGTDNRALVTALEKLGNSAGRGVAVISPQATETELDDLAAAGIVAVRLNRHADPRGGYEPLDKSLEQLIEKVAPRGWPVQIYTDAAGLDQYEGLISSSPVPLLLDHYAGLKVEQGKTVAGIDSVVDLLKDSKIWVKLSAPYRVCQGSTPYTEIADLTRQLVAANPSQVIWGSDWPFTGGGKDRENRSIEAIEPFRKFSALGFLGLIKQWLDHEGSDKVLIENPALFFGFASHKG
ncbi:hypothetical protein AS038_08470 [Arthrobacter sp. NIO-1057]|nr:hypothetical protein AS038_08470 [Arthrobacter sp. NIO-1057]